MAPDPMGDPTTREAMHLFDHNHCICVVDFGVMCRFELISNLQTVSRCCSRPASLPAAPPDLGHYAPAFRPAAKAADPIGDPATH